MTAARLVLPGTAGRDEWLEARRKGVTASEIGTVMGLAPGTQSSAYKLYHQKTGTLPEDGETPEMRRGKLLEPEVVAMFAGRHTEFHLIGDGRSLYAHPDRPWQMCTPDRLLTESNPPDCGQSPCHCFDPVAGLEAKTAAYPGDEWGDDGSDQVPVHYRCQALWNADVLGVTTWYVACLFMMTWQLRVYTVSAVDAAGRADLKLMREEARSFLDRIDLGDPPDVDWRPATTTALKRLHPDLEDREQVIPARMGRSWLAACGRVKSAEHARDRLGNQILERLGNARYAVTRDGARVATRSVSSPKRVDLGQLRAEYPEVAAACTHPPQRPVIKLLPAKPKGEPQS